MSLRWEYKFDPNYLDRGWFESKTQYRLIMATEYRREANNKEWDAALAYVQRTYPELYSLPYLIRFMSASHRQGANGRYFDESIIDRKPVRHYGHGIVHVYSGKRTRIEFIRTLVHELTHAQQHAQGRGSNVIGTAQAEREAEHAGWTAQCQYQSRYYSPQEEVTFKEV